MTGVENVHALFMYAKNTYGGTEVVTTANSGHWRGLSPFVLGPVKNFAGNEAKIFENFWQYHKVYPCHVDEKGEPSLDWFEWHHKGFASRRAVRYPMGRGAIPLYSFWYGEHLGYVEARKRIYIPFYSKLVGLTTSYMRLRALYESLGGGEHLVLRDYDAYDHLKMGRSLRDVVNDPTRKMGHAFVLAMMLTGVLEECLKS